MRYALVILVALQALDVATTAYGISTGRSYEGNPYMAALYVQGGFLALIEAKVVALGFVAVLALWLPKPGRRFLEFVIRAGAVGTAFVVTGNLIAGGLV